MSKESQRRRRLANQDAPPPDNDWLYSCPEGMPASEVAAALGVSGGPITEVDGAIWQRDWEMANAFMDEYGMPRFPEGQAVNWNAFEDWMLLKRSHSQVAPRGNLVDVSFMGEMVLVRHSYAAANNVLALLADIMQAHIDRARRNRRITPHARILLVLEEWKHPVLAGRVGRQVRWSVNSLPTGSAR